MVAPTFTNTARSYIPDYNGLRDRCFVLMTVIGALHNLSRSVGCVLLVLSSRENLILYFVGGEMALYLVFKLARGDFFWWPRVEGALLVIMSLVARVSVKVIVDFSGCLHFRHSVELGGLAFSTR